ncbi:MAG TPA: hypothetical protein VFQ74_09845 [Pseudolysinimonas sp.]|nr:hypothetical protein [Pseudolysinimonas sp.]
MIPETDLFATAFFLADHAAVENGKVYVNGGFFNQMQFASFPVAATFSVVGILNIPWSAQNQPHKFAVHFTDADGHQLDGEFSGEFQVTPNPEAGIGDPFLMPIAANANGFVFQGPGHFSAVLLVDGEELSRWSFKVNAVVVPPGPGRGAGPADIPRF